jgi:hypothetical protein
MKKRLCAAALAAVLPAATPVAAADPPQFPDLTGYAAVNDKDYTTFSAYMTAGVQFVAPGGYRCRVAFTHKAASTSMACWGKLPGTPHNYVGLGHTMDSLAATFADVDLGSMEKYQTMDADGMHEGTVSPDAYRPLPPNSKVTYTDGAPQTCGVNETMTACVVGESPDPNHGGHGFVLSPQGSWTF